MVFIHTHIRKAFMLAATGLLLAACGGGVTPPSAAPSFTIGGTLSGLSGGSVALNNNAGDAIVLTANGNFRFPTPQSDAEGYAVTVASRPSTPSQTCTVARASGTVHSADVTDIAVNCVVDVLPALSLSYHAVNGREDSLRVDIAGTFDPLMLPRFEVTVDGDTLFYCCELWAPDASGHREKALGDTFTPHSTGPHIFTARLRDGTGNVLATSLPVTVSTGMDNLLRDGDGRYVPNGAWQVLAGEPRSVGYASAGAALLGLPSPPLEPFGTIGDVGSYLSTEGSTLPANAIEMTQTVTLAFPGVLGNDRALYIGGWFGDTGTGSARMEYTVRGLNPDGTTFTMNTVTLRGARRAALQHDTRYGLLPAGTQYVDVRLILDAGVNGAAFADNLFVTLLSWPH